MGREVQDETIYGGGKALLPSILGFCLQPSSVEIVFAFQIHEGF